MEKENQRDPEITTTTKPPQPEMPGKYQPGDSEAIITLARCGKISVDKVRFIWDMALSAERRRVAEIAGRASGLLAYNGHDGGDTGCMECMAMQLLAELTSQGGGK